VSYQPFQDPVFRRGMGQAHDGLVMKPLIEQVFYDVEYPEDLTIRFRKHNLDHGPDGWFHPSTHPLWSERRLWHYLVNPSSFIPEPMEPQNNLSVTIGEALHGFMGFMLTEHGLLLPRPQEICRCGNEKCDEWYWEDPNTGARGHSDGVGTVAIPTMPGVNLTNFEFKSRSPRAKVIPDLDLDAFKAKYPTYFAQQQEYMRMSGYVVTVVIMMSVGYPWEVTEIHIPYDPKFALGVRDKYLRVRDAAAKVEMPPPCCNYGSPQAQACEFRAICPVALGETP
jgi:hypothetical protein